MDTLTALAWSMPVSAAAVACVAMWLQRATKDTQTLDEHALIVSATSQTTEANSEQIRKLQSRLDDAEKHIGQLTDRSLR